MLRRKYPPQRAQLTYRQINRLLPFTSAPLFHALQLLATGDSARFHMPGHKGEPLFNTYAEIFAIDFTETYGTGNLYTGEARSAMRRSRLRATSMPPTVFFLTGGSRRASWPCSLPRLDGAAAC
mgnify:CR=1 FL=1